MIPRRVSFRLVPAVLLLIGALTAPARGQTAFGIRWFGEPLPTAPPRALALGGLSAIAPWGGEPAAVGAGNPALTALAERVLFSITWELGRLKGSYGGETGTINSSGPRQAGIILPLGAGIALSGGLQRLTVNEFEIHTTGTVGTGLGVRYDYSGTGGLSRAYAGLSWRNASGFLAAGLSTEILFGAVKQEWAVRFDASGYVDTSDRLHRQYRGGRWTAGVQLQPLERLRLGAAWTPAGRSTVTWITSSAGAGTDSSEGELELGRNLSLGAGWSFGSVWAAYLDYTATAWDKAAWVTVPAGAAGGDPLGNPAGLRADSAVGIGLERRARPLEEQATFFDTLPLRLGVRFGQLYAPVVENDVVTGQRVSRFSVMLGSAFFIGREKMAWGDVTLQLGRYRAANNDHELFWRLTIGISGAERWFLPPQR